MCRSDRYFANQYLREMQTPEVPTTLGVSPTRGRAGQGHPLGRGCPDKVPQAFRDTFHPNLSEFQSVQEDQSDSSPEYTLDDSGDESDDVVGYDFTNGHPTTVADRDR